MSIGTFCKKHAAGLFMYCFIAVLSFVFLVLSSKGGQGIDQEAQPHSNHSIVEINNQLAGSGKSVNDRRKFQVEKSTTTPVSFLESFDKNQKIIESGSIEESSNAIWALSSGAYMSIANGTGNTNIGKLADSDPWKIIYARDNPIDTDNGLHPQNIFRLELRKLSLNYSQEAKFRILADNMSDSPNRNQTNGIHFFNRYIDANNLYYTGIRVDGYVDIKKKYHGAYYTLSHVKVFDGPSYSRDSKSSLLPKNVWFRLKTEIRNLSSNKVSIAYYIDKGNVGTWTPVVTVIDDGISFGGAALVSAGLTGIRTDFMDVSFDDYIVQSIP